VNEQESREVAVSGGDKEMLLYAWLAELLALGEAERAVFRRAKITALSAKRAAGRVFGERLDRARHPMHTHIKAVTLHQFFLQQTADGWRAQVFVDL